MRSVGLSRACLASILAFGVVPASAAPFKCPRVGGTFTFAQEANVNSLDEMTSGTISTHDVALNIFEELMTRDENNRPILDLADQLIEAPDHLTYTFKLRQGVKFHNGKPLTSADVAGSFERYKRIGLLRSTPDSVAAWDSPDPMTFVIHMRAVSPTFIDQLSSFNAPLVIVPAELKDDPPRQLHGIGTGPWQIAEFTPGGQTRFRRFVEYAEREFREPQWIWWLQASLLRRGGVPRRH